MTEIIPDFERQTASLVPSLPAKSFDEIEKLIEALQGVITGVQIDIVDGVFAPHVSWPFTEKNVKDSLLLLKIFNDLEVEMDCMCMNPETYLDTFVTIGVKRVIIHAGATEDYSSCIEHARKYGYRIGFGIKNETDVAILETYIPQFDFVQVMGIAKIGSQGQPFDKKTYDTVRTLRHTYPTLEIAVDGGVNGITIPLLEEAGANRFAPGSAITHAEDPQAAYEQLWALL